MRTVSLATARSRPVFAARILDEERTRHQLSAAEELLFVGHREPALVAAGAALEAALRIGAGSLAGRDASAAALLEALLATDTLRDDEYELLFDTLAARDRLVHGYLPDEPDTCRPERIASVVEIAIRLLEPPAA